MAKSDKRPNLFIIGAPKCGTTSLAHYLSQHQNIFLCPIKEPHYFNEDSGHRYFFDEKEYLRLFQDAQTEHEYLLEASVWYYISNTAIDNILKYNPDSRFIFMLRNPMELFFSLHRELLFGGAEDIKSPLKAWELQSKRRNGKAIPLGCTAPEMLQYQEVCSLGKHLQTLTQKIPIDRLHLVFMEDLKTDANKTYLEVLQFLGLPEIALSSYQIINIRKIRKYPFISSMIVWLSALKRKLGITRGIGLAGRINRANVTTKLTVDAAMENKLKEVLNPIFLEDIEILEKLTNRNLNHWKNL